MEARVQLLRVVVQVADGLVIEAGAVLHLAGEELAGVASPDDEHAAGFDRRPGHARKEAGAHLDDGHAGEDECAGDEDDGEREVAVLDPEVCAKDENCDEEHGPEEGEDIAEAAVGPDRAVDAEGQVGGDVSRGEEGQDASDEDGIFAGDVAIEAEHEGRSVGGGDDGHIEDDGSEEVEGVAGEHPRERSANGVAFTGIRGQRAPLPLRTTANARKRITISVNSEWPSTYCRS